MIKNIVQAIRSDQAGETGAVWIYKAMNLVNNDPKMKKLIDEHLDQESQHLDIVNGLLQDNDKTKLLPLWAAAGFFTGFVPAVMGNNWMLHTIAAVETFVDKHYADQVKYLNVYNPNINRINVKDRNTLKEILEKLRNDELKHKKDALDDAQTEPSAALKLWCNLVAFGSENAVKLASKF